MYIFQKKGPVMKKYFKSYYAGLCIALLSCVGVIESKFTIQTTLKTNKIPAPKVNPAPKVITQSTLKTDTMTADPEIVTIDHSVKEIKTQQNCNADKWKNNQDNSCQCCLTYGKGQGKAADQVITHCTNTSKQCSATSIANLKKKYNAESMSPDDFINKVYNETVAVSKMVFSPSLLNPDGTLTTDGLATVLVQAYNEGKLKNKSFSDKKCLTVKSISTGTSYQTLQIFKVTSTCDPSIEALYFVKESKDSISETMNLKEIEEFGDMKSIMTPNIKKDFPSLALPLFYFSYHPHNQKIHYVATMPAAHGMVLCELLTQFRDNQSPENTARMERAYTILGKELSNMHKQYVKTNNGRMLVHGDLHCHNIFYDEKLGHFTFIDNETLVHAIEGSRSVVDDFIRVIFTPYSNSESLYNFDQLIRGINPGTYFNVTLKPLLKGYISVYSTPAEQKDMLLKLKGKLTSYLQDGFFTFDEKYLQKLSKDYIAPICDEIAKTIGAQ